MSRDMKPLDAVVWQGHANVIRLYLLAVEGT
jgi:homogentisate 1,2-dioxygenase